MGESLLTEQVPSQWAIVGTKRRTNHILCVSGGMADALGSEPSDPEGP